MTWKKIIGQNRAKKILQRAILENRIAHAYCLWGNEGIGKEALALEFARTVNCENPFIGEHEIEACGVCHSCRQSEKLQHPNIGLIFSLPAGTGSSSKNDSAFDKLSDEQYQTVMEQIELKAADQYYKISIPNATQIKIASIRDIKKNLFMTSSGRGRRCIIIFNAEEMSTESANAFLKSLEEPNENTTILLTSSRHEAILPTILSRCQQIRCEPLSDDDICSALVEKYKLESGRAKLISALAQGSFSRAVEFLDSDMAELREDVVNILRTSLKKSNYRIELFKQIEELTKNKDKNFHDSFLNLMIIWMRDVYSLSHGESDSMINIDQKETIEKFAVNFGKKDIESAVTTIEKSILLIKRNVQMQLIYLSMFMKLRKIFLV